MGGRGGEVGEGERGVGVSPASSFTCALEGFERWEVGKGKMADFTCVVFVCAGSFATFLSEKSHLWSTPTSLSDATHPALAKFGHEMLKYFSFKEGYVNLNHGESALLTRSSRGRAKNGSTGRVRAKRD